MGSYKERPEHWIIVDQLASIILQNVEGIIIDIGIGASTTVLAKHAVFNRRRQYSCDIREKYCIWADRELRSPITFCGDSTDFINQLPNEPIAIAFLDASHQYQKVIDEVRLLLPKMAINGIMFLHDTSPPTDFVTEDGSKCGDVYRVRQELEQNKSLQIFTWPFTAFNFGLTMIMRKELNQPESRR